METLQQKLEELEAKIYDTYYEKNPKGDARNNLWRMVIQAKKGENTINALEKILKSVKKGVIK